MILVELSGACAGLPGADRPCGAGARRGDARAGITFASQRAIDRLHARGLRVDFWAIDDPEEARRLLAMGADGIMTDDVRSVAPAFSSRA